MGELMPMGDTICGCGTCRECDLRAKLHAADDEIVVLQGRLFIAEKEQKRREKLLVDAAVHTRRALEAEIARYKEALERIAEIIPSPFEEKKADEMWRIAREALSTPCDGSRDCQAETHIQGCFASTSEPECPAGGPHTLAQLPRDGLGLPVQPPRWGQSEVCVECGAVRPEPLTSEPD